MKYIFLLMLAIFISACIPKMHTVSPAIKGRVVDAISHKPLKNVSVGGTMTDKNGQFFIDGEKELGIGTTMGGVWKIPVLNVRVTKKGYTPTSYSCEILSTQDGCFDVEIKLHKAEK